MHVCKDCGRQYGTIGAVHQCLEHHRRVREHTNQPQPPAARKTLFFEGDGLQVTMDEAEAIKKFVQALLPGVYIKCSWCEKFKPVTEDLNVTTEGVYCKECV